MDGGIIKVDPGEFPGVCVCVSASRGIGSGRGGVSLGDRESVCLPAVGCLAS